MEAWLILSKFFIAVYIALLSIEANIKSLGIIILSLLILIFFNTIMYIFESKKVRQAFVVIACLYTIICIGSISPIFCILFPINLFEIVYLKESPEWLSVIISLLVIFFLDAGIVKEYVLVGMLSYIIIKLIYRNEERVLKLREENDNLKQKNDTLNESFRKDAEYHLQTKYMSQIEERNKIAQEIHDSIGHTISGSLMQLEVVKFIMNKDNKKAESMLQDTINILREGMESIRATLRNIKPPSEQLGINRLKLILDEFQINSKIQVSIFYEGNLDKVSYEQWNLINSNTKEALTNVMKYSKASQVKVKIEVLNKLIKAEIKDNGLGSFKIAKGLGIRGMEERCASLNGKLIIDGSDGFSIIMLIPIVEV